MPQIDNYHPVCSSLFVTRTYIQTMMGNNLTLVSDSKLFTRQFFAAQLSLLSSLCVIINSTVDTSIVAFYRKQLITRQALTMDQFINQMTSITDQFYLEMTRTLQNTFDYLQAIIHGDGIMSSYFTNYIIKPNPSSIDLPSLILPVTYGNCSCGTSLTCSEPMIIDNTSFAGLFIGCLPLSALLQLTLECFYNQTCLEKLHSALFDNATTKYIPTSLVAKSRFPPNTSLQLIIDELFIENWSHYADYDVYFRHCLPLNCVYIQIKKFDMLYIVTTIIGLVGGLAVVLRLTCPLLVKGYYYLVYIVKNWYAMHVTS